MWFELFFDVFKVLLLDLIDESVLHNTFHFFGGLSSFNTKNMVVWQIFGVYESIIDRPNLALFVKISLSAESFLDVGHKATRIFVFRYHAIWVALVYSRTFACSSEHS